MNNMGFSCVANNFYYTSCEFILSKQTLNNNFCVTITFLGALDGEEYKTLNLLYILIFKHESTKHDIYFSKILYPLSLTTIRIQISWLLKKPADQDPHFFTYTINQYL